MAKIKLEEKYLYGYYLCQLPQEKQDEIMEEVKRVVDELLLTDEEKQEAIENAECEKVCNLTETVDFIFIKEGVEVLYNINEETVKVAEDKNGITTCTFEDGTIRTFENYDKAIRRLEKMGYRF